MVFNFAFCLSKSAALVVCSSNSSVVEGTRVMCPMECLCVVSEDVVCARAAVGSPSSLMATGLGLEETEEVPTKSRSDSWQLESSVASDGNGV